MSLVFRYRIRLPDGTEQKGQLQAIDRAAASEQLRRLGGFLLELEAEKQQENNEEKTGLGARIKKMIQRPPSLKDRIIFTQQLAIMLHAGITLVQALKSQEEESTNKNFRKILHNLQHVIQDGQPLSAALSHHPQAFSRVYIEMIRSAEQTGNLSEVLGDLTHQQQKEYDLRAKVKGALMYPAIVSILMVGVIVVVITFIVPKLTALFTDSGASLPATTRFLITVSDLFVHQWYIIIAVVVGISIALKMIGNTPKGRRFFDAVKLKVPVLGKFVKAAYLARFCQTFGSLSSAGIPVLETFSTLKGVVNNVLYEEEIDRIAREVENGNKVSVAIRKSKLFPGMVGQLANVGEQSGDLSGVFTTMGDFFEKEVDGMAKNLSTVLEPLIMIVMGVVIGFILVAVLQPIYGLVDTV